MKAGWVLAAVFCLAGSGSAQQQTSTAARTMTGCLDERPGPQYVLRDDQQLRVIAELSPHRFPVRGFAKYLGHKVEVSGPATPADCARRIEVRTIRSISDTCSTGGPRGASNSGKPRARVGKSQVASGCMDEEPGQQYVLRSAGELRVLYALEPDGVKPQAFAKYLGHKVRVRGSLFYRNGRRLLKVGAIEEQSPICSPRRPER